MKLLPSVLTLATLLALTACQQPANSNGDKAPENAQPAQAEPAKTEAPQGENTQEAQPSEAKSEAEAAEGEAKAEASTEKREAQHQAYQSEIKGYGTIDYTVDVQAGEKLAVKMKSPSAYFNVYAPNADEAVFNGSADGEQYSETVQTAGTYRVQVYLMRSQARKEVAVPYDLTIDVTP